MQNTVEENTEIIPPLQSKTVKVVANVFLLKSCSVLLAVILHFTIDHFYGPEGVGAFGLYMSVITITGLLASFGFGNAALKLSGAVGSDQELASVQSAYNMMLRLTSVAAGVCAVFVLFSAQKMSEVFLDDPYKAPVFYCSALAILPFALLEVSSEMIRGRGKTNLYMIFKETGLWLAAAPVLIFLLVSQYGYLSPIVSHLVAVLMFSVVAILVVQELLKPAEEVEHPNSISISNLLKLSLPMLMSKGLLWAGFWIDILIAGVFMGGADIGIYLVLDRIAAFGKQVSYSINVYVAPRIAYHFQQKRLKHLEKLTKDSVRYSVWILAPIMIILAIVAKPVLGIFGEEYMFHIGAFLILLLANFIDTTCGPVGYLLNMTGKEQSFVHIMIGTTMMRVILLLVFVGYFQMGILGAALSHLGFTLLWNLLSLVTIRKHLNFQSLYIPFYSNK